MFVGAFNLLFADVEHLELIQLLKLFSPHPRGGGGGGYTQGV
jgi:hypothetical protein